MTKRNIGRWLAVVGCLAFAATETRGADVPVFGPREYVRQNGQPQTVTDTFSVAQPSAGHLLRIQNGSNGRARVTSATVTLNGVDVARPSDFGSGVASIEKTVTVAASNQIAVRVGGQPGGGFTLVIVRPQAGDTTPPQIVAAVAPAPNAGGWNRADATVTFTCTDAGSGIASCTAPVVVSTEGAGQTVPGEAVDNAGNRATTTATVSLDKTAPALAGVASPTPNAAGWNNSAVTVSFQCSDAVSGIAVCPAPATVAIETAGQPIAGEAVDVAGNTATATVNVRLDTTAPVVTTTVAPAPNAAGWNTGDATVTFACTDALSGVAVCPPPAVVTAEGASTADGTAVDVAGNSMTATRTVSIDRTPPVVTITSPLPGPAVSPVTVVGTATDQGSGVAGVTCNGAPAARNGDTFTCVVALVPGNNTIVAAATDIAGHTGDASVVVSTVIPPKVKVTAPAPLSLYRNGPVEVSGTIDRPVEVVLVNGVAATVSGGTFTAPAVPLREGHNILTATATTAEGGVGTASVTVTADMTAPNVRIDTPSAGAMLSSSQVTVTGTINDVVSGTVNDEQATVFVNGVQATVSNRSFVVRDLLLTRGLNTLTAVARDRVGNEGRAAIQVIFEDQASQQRLVILAGNNQSAIIGQALPAPLVVALLDAEDRPLADRAVTFSVLRGDGNVIAFPEEGRSITLRTDERGQASVGFELGTRTGVGNNQVAVTSAGVRSEVIFTASANVGPPAFIRADAVMGENFRGSAGIALPEPFRVIVLDAGGNPVAGARVVFTVQKGGGTLDGGQTSLTRTTDGDGKASVVLTLGPEAGISNNVVLAALEGSVDLPAAFTATAYRPGPPSETRVSGIVLDNANVPIPGARAQIAGTTLSASTDDTGRFTIRNVPVGSIMLLIDGDSSPRPETFPHLAFHLTTVVGQDNTIGMPIFLPPLDTVNQKMVRRNETVTLTMADVPGVVFTILPNSATFPDGSKEGIVRLTQVHADKVPMPPPYGTAPRIVWTLQPAGARFDPPIRVQLPNVDNLAPGQVIEIFQFDHDIEQFTAMGPARVSEDGAVIVSDPGFGVTKAGWGGSPPPPPPKKTCTGKQPDCSKCDTNTGAWVPDPGATGSCDEGVTRSFVHNGIRVSIADSCMGKCENGACKPWHPEKGLSALNTGVRKAIDLIMGGCMGPINGAAVQQGLRTQGLNVGCDNSKPLTCAYTFSNSNTVTFGNASCLSIEGAVIHELVHGFTSFKHMKCKKTDPKVQLGNIDCFPGDDCQECKASDFPDIPDAAYGCQFKCTIGGDRLGACK